MILNIERCAYCGRQDPDEPGHSCYACNAGGCSCTPDPDTGELYDDDGWPCPHG